MLLGIVLGIIGYFGTGMGIVITLCSLSDEKPDLFTVALIFVFWPIILVAVVIAFLILGFLEVINIK